MEKTYLYRDLLTLEPRTLLVAFQEMAHCISAEQERVLFDMIESARNTEFGRRHGFSEIKSIDDFRRRVPVSEYEDYSDEIERMKDGEADVLFPGKPAAFVISTGTTGAPKYIPESKAGSAVKLIVEILRFIEFAVIAGSSAAANMKIFTVTNPAVYGMTRGGIPAGAASGQGAANYPAAKGRMLPPPEFLRMTGLSIPTTNYLLMRMALADREITGIISNNVAHIHRLFMDAEAQAEQLIRDIRNGEISVDMGEADAAALAPYTAANPERAAELMQILSETGGFPIRRIWPNYGMTICWLSGSVGHSAKEFRKLFPENAKLIDWGYGASEGKFTVSTAAGQSAGLTAVFGYFFEFLPLDGGTPLLLSEVREGVPYELILTSYSGLYRYNIHDIVRFERIDGGLHMAFLCKQSEHLDFDETRLYSSELTRIIEDFERDSGVLIRLFQGRKRDGALELFVEPADGDFRLESFERCLRGALAEKGIGLKGVTLLEDGYRDSLFGKFIAEGKNVNQTKLPVFI